MNRVQNAALVALRLLVGWHIAYEGVAKLLDPYWSSAGYLGGAQWWFKDLFVNLAANGTAVTIIDAINAWGLTLIGLLLMLGLLQRAACVAAIVLLALYYLAAPPFVGLRYAMPAEGSYVVVNKVLVEIGALWVLYAFPASRVFGLDALLARRRAPVAVSPTAPQEAS